MSFLTKDRVQQIIENRPDGVSAESVLQSLEKRGYEIEGLGKTPSTQSIQPQQTMAQKAEGVRAERSQDLLETGLEIQQIGADRTSQYQGINQRIESGETPFMRGQFQKFGAGLGATLDTGYTAAKGLGKYLLPQSAEDKVGQAVAGLSREIGRYGQEFFTELQNSPDQNKQKIARDLEEVTYLYKTDPDFRDTLSATGSVVEALSFYSGKPLKAGVDSTFDAIASGAKYTDDMFKASLRQADVPHQQITPETASLAVKAAPIEQRKEAITSLAQTYENSLLNTKGDIKKIEAIARERNMSTTEVLEEFVNYRGLPGRVNDEGRVSFDGAMRDLQARQNRIGETVQKVLDTKVELTPVATLRQQALRDIEQNGAILNRGKVRSEVNRLFDDLQNEFPNGIPAGELNRIRIEANAKFKEQFEVDANKAIGNASRNRIDEIVGDDRIRNINAEWGRLQDQIEIADILNQAKVDVGLLNNSLGSYMAAASVGSVGLATGSGSLVIAGLASTYGGKTFANWVRRRKINSDEVQDALRYMRQDESLVNDLLKDVEGADKEMLERLLLPVPGETSAGQIPIPLGPPTTGRNVVKAVDAPKGFPRNNPETGRFERTYKASDDLH